VVAPHGLKTTEEVLVNTSPHVVKAWLTVSSRGSFVKDPGGPTGSLGHGALKDVVGLPSRQFRLFDGYKINIGADRTKHFASRFLVIVPKIT
jgi:hypothetical protein